jgi:hypothetical protein
MNNEISKQGTPEENELEAKRRELEALAEQVSERELELATSRAKLHHFEDNYLREVGIHLTELDELKAQIAEKMAARSPSDETVQSEAKAAREQAKESYKATEELDEEEQRERSFEPSEELQKLYRKAARKFHPDTTTDEEERKELTKIMAEINRLYEEGKEDELRELIENYSRRPEAVKGEGVAYDLVRAIRKIDQLRDRLVTIEEELEQLRQSHLYELFKQVEDAKEEGTDLLKNMQASIRDEIQQSQEELDALD